MKKLSFAPAARNDLRKIALAIADDNPTRAVTFIAELETKSAQAAERPLSFPARDDLSVGLRSIVHGKYLIFFRDLGTEARIVRIVHGARDLRRLIGRR